MTETSDTDDDMRYLRTDDMHHLSDSERIARKFDALASAADSLGGTPGVQEVARQWRAAARIARKEAS